MSLARKLKRKNVVPVSVQRKIHAQGQLQGVSNMVRETEAKLQEAYDMGFDEASAKAHMAVTVLAIAALRDTFGFGKIRAKRFADKLVELSSAVHEGYVEIPDILQALVDEGLDFCSTIGVEDDNGKVIKMDVDKLMTRRANYGEHGEKSSMRK